MTEGFEGGVAQVRGWFAEQGWAPFPFQEATWAAYGRGESGLVHVPTGAGKTYAAFGGPLAGMIAAPRARRGARVLYLTPLRAVAHDIELALARAVEALCPSAAVESRTGDTSGRARARQTRALPEVLVTTPESVTLQLARADAAKRFGRLEAVIVDEWHAMLGNKRGTQTELALARLRTLAPDLRVWALSATLPNVVEAAEAAVGPHRTPTLISAEIDRPIHVECLIPDSVEAFPWAGHLGLQMVPKVIDALDIEVSTLVFTNTRNQAELWFSAIAQARPDWVPAMGLHHSAVDRDERARVERGLSAGDVRLVICTSSLDLGVDFGPVERVVNIGAPKGVARLIQRAGRSGHRPGAPCRILCVPTHALQLLEIRAARAAITAGEVEPRRPLPEPLDVLCQHMVTRALGGGFTADDLYAEVRDTAAYGALTREAFDWALRLVREGGDTLKAYPEYHKVVADEAGVHHIANQRMARMHRLSVGTITDEPSVAVRYRNGKTLGTVEENFVARLKPGDRFVFAGKLLQFVRLRDLTAVVRPGKGRPTAAPRWAGSRMPFTTHLAAALLRTLAGEITGGPELAAAAPILDLQRALSTLPGPGAVHAEVVSTEDGHHLFLFPFAGRAAHEGLAALLALRLTRREPATFTAGVDDYGVELMTDAPFPFEAALADPATWSVEGLVDDLMAAINLGELARRQFRSIARVAGLVFNGYPGKQKTMRQVQSSAGLLFDVFNRFDPENLLLHQARSEVLSTTFEVSRLRDTLRQLAELGVAVAHPPHPTPLAFPLMVNRLHETTYSSEPIAQRIERMVTSWSR